MKKKNFINIMLITGLFMSPISVMAMQKSETIYSNLNYDGTPYKTVVSSHLSWLEEKDVEDETELKNILNISGNEKYEQKEKKLSWQSTGKDIFYQGETEKESPIKTKITYYLNNEEKDVEEMLGKEGTVKIQIHFQNDLKNIVKVNGVNTELYTPFVTAVGTMLKSEQNKNITVTNGKVISTGTKNMIVGLASPGLYQSLDLSELKDFDEITITYETTSFSLSNIYIVSTPKLLEETDLSIFQKMDELNSNMKELQKSIDLLEQGTKELENGAYTLTNGSKELMNGLKSAQSAIDTLKNGSLSLDNGLDQIIAALNNVKKELANNQLESSFKNLNVLKTQNQNTMNTLLKKSGMSEANLKATYEKYNLSTYQGEDTTLQNAKSTYEFITLLNANNTAIDTTIKTVNDLMKKTNTLISTLNENLTKISAGSKQITSGLTNLKAGVDKLYNGSYSLYQGTNTLYKGTTTLKNGTQEFNKQGIQKLNRYVNTIKSYSNKMEALVKLSEDYHGFASNNSDNINFVSMIKSAKITYTK